MKTSPACSIAFSAAVAALLFGCAGSRALGVPKRVSQSSGERDAAKARIDIVFAIDCSGSMGGVIETAKQKIWGIVNQIARAKPSPILRIGLIGYGDGDHQFRKYPLSDDLDEVYQHLMTFRDEGWSDEYVGLLVHKARSEMNWAHASRQLNVIYMVGNETARQGPQQYDYTKTTPRAVSDGILVNAIYCGSADGEETWREMARLGRGQYLQIAADGGGISIPTPFDRQLDTLNISLNKTYLPFGAQGQRRAQNQVAQDSNSKAVGGYANSASRAMAKSSAQYNNRGWDLVDAEREKGFDVGKLKREELPAAMQKMTPAQRRAFIARNGAQRKTIQAKIRRLSAQRENYIRVQMKKRGLKESNALDGAIRDSITRQAKGRGYRF